MQLRQRQKPQHIGDTMKVEEEIQQDENGFDWRLLEFIGKMLLVFGVILALIIAFTALGLAVENPQGFFGVQTGVHTTDSTTDDEKTLIVTCTNITLDNNGTDSFKGETFIKYNCPISDNDCSDWICKTDGQCQQELTNGSACYKSEQCGVGGFCVLSTCQCQILPNSTVGCTMDSECPIISDRGTCAENLCNMNGVCEETLTLGSTCWFDGQCMPFEYCNVNTCSCQNRPIIPCEVDSDCPDISDRGICPSYECISNICTEVIGSLGECWFDNQCDTGFECDTATCGCVEISSGCQSDSQCTDVSDRGGNCSAILCGITGICNETIINGNCWYDGQCALNEVCDTSNCTCISAPVFLCQVDADCTDISDRGSCVSNVCTAGRCIETPVGECWFDGQCASVEERCDQTICTCIPFIIPPCESDLDCPDISDRGSCVQYNCTAGRCNETILGECWFDGQCAIDQICDQSTCSCISSADSCATGYNIQELPPQLSGLPLSCGSDVAIYGNFAVEVCINTDVSGTWPYIILSYGRIDNEWFWINYFVTSVTITSFPTESSAKIAMYEDIVAFSARSTSASQPQPTTLTIYRILSSGSLVQLQSMLVNTSDTTGSCVDIWNTTIVVNAGSSYIFDQTGVSTWSLTQILEEPTNTTTFFDCSIFESNLVLSSRNVSAGYSWIAYRKFSGWSQVGNYTNTVWDGKWYVAQISNNLETLTGHEFTVIASPADYTVAITEVASSGGIQYNQPELVTTTGPGILSSFDQNWIIGDVLFLNSFTSSISFQSSFAGMVVVSNDVWTTDPIFSVSSDGDFTNGVSYANYCTV